MKSSLNPDQDYPEHAAKAYNSRVVTSYLAHVSGVWAAATQAPEDCLVATCMFALASWFDHVEQAGRYLSQHEATQIHALGLLFLRTYKRLGGAAIRAGKLRWPIRPKFHAFQHLNIDMLNERYNCRFYHSFCDESMVGVMKRLARTCNVFTLERSTLRKYLLRCAFKHLINTMSVNLALTHTC